MKVYFKPPEFKPDPPPQIVKDCMVRWTLVFPNEKTFNNRVIFGHLRIWTKEEAEFCRNLQNDMMNLALEVNDYLVNLDIDGEAIIFYRANSLTSKRKAKKFNFPELFFSFSFVIATPSGESDATIDLGNWGFVNVWVSGGGLASKTIKEVVMKFAWKSDVKQKINFYSKFNSYKESFKYGQYCFW